jgi:hypothetical protein
MAHADRREIVVKLRPTTPRFHELPGRRRPLRLAMFNPSGHAECGRCGDTEIAESVIESLVATPPMTMRNLIDKSPRCRRFASNWPARRLS